MQTDAGQGRSVSLKQMLDLLYFFFLPLVLIGAAGGHSCLSAARWVAWRRDIPWVLRVSAMESLHHFSRSIVFPFVVLSKCLSTAGLLSQSQLHQSPVSQHCLFPPPTTRTRGWTLRFVIMKQMLDDIDLSQWNRCWTAKGCFVERGVWKCKFVLLKQILDNVDLFCPDLY